MNHQHSNELTSDTGPFSIIPEWVITADISHGAVRLYALLARYADYATGEAFPSRRTLANRMRTSPDTIDRFVKELVSIDAIGVTRRRIGEAYTSNLYIVKRVQGDRTDAATSTCTGTGDRTDTGTGDRTNAELTTTSQRQPVERQDDSPVRQVFDTWVSSTGRDPIRTKLDTKRQRAIEWALKHYPIDDVLAAVDGWRHSPFHRGENDQGKTYNDITLLLRGAEKLEYFRDAVHRQTVPRPRRPGVDDTWRRLQEMMDDE